jgi:hypothetical protein
MVNAPLKFGAILVLSLSAQVISAEACRGPQFETTTFFGKIAREDRRRGNCSASGID